MGSLGVPGAAQGGSGIAGGLIPRCVARTGNPDQRRGSVHPDASSQDRITRHAAAYLHGARRWLHRPTGIMKPSIRRRLTISYGIVTAATLAALGTAACALTHQFLMRAVDATLTMEYDDVVEVIRWPRST